MSSTITKSKKSCVCSACGKEGHRKSNEKFHPIVPKEENVSPYMEELIKCVKCETDTKRKDMKWTNSGGSYTDVCQKCHDKKQLIQKMETDALLEKHRLENLQDEQDLIIIKSSAPAPIPAPVFLPRKHRGECGLENGEIHFPLLRMGCSEDARGIFMTITIPLRPIIDKAFFEDFAKIMRKYRMCDWSAMSFMRNIIHPNREHIKRTMNLDDQFLERVMEDAYVVINQWYSNIGEETYDKLGNLEYMPLNHTTFFTSRHCDY